MDLVVTVPKKLWPDWIAEGDAAGDAPTGEEWGFHVSQRPRIGRGERLYVVAWGLLRGYAPVVRVHEVGPRSFIICREADAVACTVKSGMRFDGFRGARARWWEREQEVPFLEWKTAGLPAAMRELVRSQGI
jgi:hypothetical protein